MAVAILPKRSHTLSSTPTTGDLVEGELAVNTADKKIYMRDASNNIVTVANDGVSSAEATSKAVVMAIALG
jgi:hypothetical protein|tara:strand:+ start:366 stop:578 length:213 start_codon:yes stop_codon:yes gene_type:complete